MDYKTKLKPGDTGWFMYDNKPLSFKIYSVSVKHIVGKPPTISYTLESGSGELDESGVFQSKAELCQAVFGDSAT